MKPDLHFLCGPLKEARLVKNRASWKIKGFAYIEYLNKVYC